MAAQHGEWQSGRGQRHGEGRRRRGARACWCGRRWGEGAATRGGSDDVWRHGGGGARVEAETGHIGRSAEGEKAHGR